MLQFTPQIGNKIPDISVIFGVLPEPTFRKIRFPLS